MSAVGRRRRQSSFEFFRTGLEPFLQSGRQRPAANELLFQAGRQTILLCEPGRQLVPMPVVPSAQLLTIAILIKLGALVVIALLVVALAMALSLCERDTAAGKNHRDGDAGNPFSYSHWNSCLGGGLT